MKVQVSHETHDQCFLNSNTTTKKELQQINRASSTMNAKNMTGTFVKYPETSWDALLVADENE